MEQLPPEYLAEIGRQIAMLSAFLGGFAATFLGTLLSVNHPRRLAGWAAGSAAVSAASFAVAVVAASMLSIVLHPSAPARIRAAANVQPARVVAGLGFLVGMYAMLASLGLSGWVRSSRLGWVTSASALLAAIVATLVVAGG